MLFFLAEHAHVPVDHRVEAQLSPARALALSDTHINTEPQAVHVFAKSKARVDATLNQQRVLCRIAEQKQDRL